MPKGYRQLTQVQRYQIEAYLKTGMSQSKIATAIGCHKSSISRELKRNSLAKQYCATDAHSRSQKRKKSASSKVKLATKPLLKIAERKLIHFQWSPEQISGWMADNLGKSISTERIYQHIWQAKAAGKSLHKYLRRSGKKYNKRGSKGSSRGQIVGRVDIDERPDIVEEKSRVGDWELDTIIGKNHKGAIVSMVERKSKFTKLALVEKKDCVSVGVALIKSLKPLKKRVVTLTSDNGKEFASHQIVAENLDAKMYFAKPYSSWQRGLNEHTNGLVRQYFPKKTDFTKLDENEVRKVENLLNNRPRKSLNYRTPLDVFREAGLRASSVALQS